MASESTAAALKALLSHGMWTEKTKLRVKAWKEAADAIQADDALPDNMVKGLCR